MITTGIIIAAIGAALFLTGMVLHLLNMKNMFNNDMDDADGGRIILPFLIAIPGSLAFIAGAIVAIIGVVLLFL